MQCCWVFLFFPLFWNMVLTCPDLITLIFPPLWLCGWILKAYSAFALEQHIKQEEFMLRQDSFYVEVRFLLELFTPDVWKWDHYLVALQSKDTNWWIFHPCWTFPSLHTDVHCFRTLFWPVEFPAWRLQITARKLNLLSEMEHYKNKTRKKMGNWTMSTVKNKRLFGVSLQDWSLYWGNNLVKQLSKVRIYRNIWFLLDSYASYLDL